MVLQTYHTVVKGIGDMVNTMKVQSGRPVRIIPWRRIFVSLVTLIVFRFIPIPHPPGSKSEVDVNIWVGTLSFEGALAIGFVAVASWIASMMSKLAPPFLATAIDLGYLRWTGPKEDGRTTLEILREGVRSDEFGLDQLNARFAMSGLFMIVMVIVIMPLRIWLIPSWQVAILMASVVWVVLTIWSLWIIGLLLFHDAFREFLAKLKSFHEENKQMCPECNKGPTELPSKP
jgi:hypothetical protein